MRPELRVLRRSPWLGLFGRQLARDVGLHVAIAFGAAITLFVAIDSVEVVNRALSRATLLDLLRLQLYGIPAVVQQFASFCVLIGTMTALASLVRRGEIVAFFAAGASPFAILRPIVCAGLVIAAAEAGLTEWIAPRARAEVSAARHRLGLPSLAGDKVGSVSQTWFRGEDLVYRVEALEDPRGRVLGHVLVLRIVEGHLVERWDVDRLVYEDGRWIGEGVVHRQFGADAELATERLERALLSLVEDPEDFVRSIGAPERLSYAALAETTRARERLGQPALAHRLELYRRHTYPLLLVVAVVLGAAVALRLGRRPTVAGA
ncbi:LptF/LptG family permease, partial [Myxococcota bacterium]|nr:LptF/LptG family permease [Myxococcota bacterium]